MKKQTNYLLTKLSPFFIIVKVANGREKNNSKFKNLGKLLKYK